jgi:carboxyl-terminal processing protease
MIRVRARRLVLCCAVVGASVIAVPSRSVARAATLRSPLGTVAAAKRRLPSKPARRTKRSTTVPTTTVPETTVPGTGLGDILKQTVGSPGEPGFAPPTTVAQQPPLSGGAAPTTTLAPVPPSITPVAYVDYALRLIERFTVKRKVVDLAAIRRRAEDRATTAQTLADTYPIIREALEALGDRHSSLLDPAAAKSLVQGSSTGFGIRLFPGNVLWVFAGSPAEAAGLRSRDRLVTINGKPVAETTAADRSGETLRFGVERRSQGVLEFSVTRGPLVTAEKPTMRTIDGRIGYIDLPGSIGDATAEEAFSREGLDQFRAVDTGAQGAQCGWVLDMRRNSGGRPFSMLAPISPLLPLGVLLSSQYGDGTSEQWVLGTDRITVGGNTAWRMSNPYRTARADVPVAILMSPLTASAAEAATIAFVGRPNVRRFGEPSVGVTSANAGVLLQDGAFIQVTTSLDVDRAGVVYDGPLVPDEAITTDFTVLGQPEDAVLNAAQAWLRAQPACNGG